jgi:hypothetical protein
MRSSLAHASATCGRLLDIRRAAHEGNVPRERAKCSTLKLHLAGVRRSDEAKLNLCTLLSDHVAGLRHRLAAAQSWSDQPLPDTNGGCRAEDGPLHRQRVQPCRQPDHDPGDVADQVDGESPSRVLYLQRQQQGTCGTRNTACPRQQRYCFVHADSFRSSARCRGRAGETNATRATRRTPATATSRSLVLPSIAFKSAGMRSVSCEQQ